MPMTEVGTSAARRMTTYRHTSRGPRSARSIDSRPRSRGGAVAQQEQDEEHQRQQDFLPCRGPVTDPSPRGHRRHKDAEQNESHRVGYRQTLACGLETKGATRQQELRGPPVRICRFLRWLSLSAPSRSLSAVPRRTPPRDGSRRSSPLDRSAPAWAWCWNRTP